MKIEINVPTSLSEVTLGQYQKFLKISDKNPKGNFLNAKMIEIFCGIPLSESYKMKMSSAVAILDILDDLLNTQPKHVERFTLRGVEYGFIPDLNEMSLGEYIDLDNNASKWEEMHVAMNVLYRPIQDSKAGKYNIKEYDINNPEFLKDMPLDAVLGSLFFFYNLGVELSKDTILYSEAGEQMTTQGAQTLGENGVGINHFMVSLKGIFKDLNISLN